MAGNKKTQKDHQFKQIFYIYLGFIILINLPALFLTTKLLFNFYAWDEKVFYILAWLWLFITNIRREKFKFNLTYETKYLLLAIGLIVLGFLADLEILLYAGLAVSIYGLLNYFYGRKTANKYLGILFLLVYLAKIKSPTLLNLISLKLRIFATHAGELLLNLAGVPVKSVGGTYLCTPDKNFMIVDACSGLNNLMALTFLGLFYEAWQKAPLMKSIKTGLFSVMMALASNILRVFSLIFISYRWNEQVVAADTFLHKFIGMVWFILALYILIRWSDSHRKSVK